jgi:hypothetical protein
VRFEGGGNQDVGKTVLRASQECQRVTGIESQSLTASGDRNVKGSIFGGGEPANGICDLIRCEAVVGVIPYIREGRSASRVEDVNVRHVELNLR